MSGFYFKGVSPFRLSGFLPVRDALSNLENILHLAEIVNTSHEQLTREPIDNFDFAIFSGNYSRAIISKADGFFSMALPFQVIDYGETIAFNVDSVGEKLSGRVISIFRNAIHTARMSGFSYEDIMYSLSENFGLEVNEAIRFCDVFITLLTDDHGYFRFDDDEKNENGAVHPRYHFDFFYKNASSVKIGMDGIAGMDCFLSLVDATIEKHYLRKQ